MAKDNKADQGVTLSDLIMSTVEQLKLARQKSKNQDKEEQDNDSAPILELEKCELELAVAVKAEGGGGIKIYLLDLMGKASKETVSKIKLSFGPMGTSAFGVGGAHDVDPDDLRKRLRKGT